MSKYKISTLVIGILILLLSWHGRSIHTFAMAKVGSENLIYLVILFTLSVILFVKRFFTFNFKLIPYAILILVLAILILKPDTTELVHFSEYGAFALSLTLWINKKDKNKKLLTCLGLASLLGITDEILQAINPTRFFDLRDILLNALGALVALLSFNKKKLLRNE